MRKIVIYPAKILRKKTEKIEKVDKKLLLGIEDLKKLLRDGDNAAGLAAPQIGLNKRFFGSKELVKDGILIFINPEIKKEYGEKIYPKIIDENKKEEHFLEGCLSFPGSFGTVKRFLKIDVEWQELKEGRLVTKNKKLNGFEAIVFQHELDHLEGVVFTDHIKRDKGKFYKSVGGKMVESTLDY
jgi:peptide deformylase